MNALYTLSACEKLMNDYINLGGEVTTIQEGVLGLGIVVCQAKGFKTAIIKEVYLNDWSSAHSVRFYKKLPQTILKEMEG